MRHILRRGTPRFVQPHTISRDEFLTPFDQVFDDFITTVFPGFARDVGSDFFSKGSYPKVNVINHSDTVIIEAAVPGLTKSAITLDLKDDTLTIKGESNQHEEIKDSQYLYRELKKSTFTRSFNLSNLFDKQNITANCEDGILTITIPKKIETKEEVPDAHVIKIN